MRSDDEEAGKEQEASMLTFTDSGYILFCAALLLYGFMFGWALCSLTNSLPKLAEELDESEIEQERRAR